MKSNTKIINYFFTAIKSSVSAKLWLFYSETSCYEVVPEFFKNSIYNSHSHTNFFNSPNGNFFSFLVTVQKLHSSL